jgi:hypothetical protein
MTMASGATITVTMTTGQTVSPTAIATMSMVVRGRFEPYVLLSLGIRSVCRDSDSDKSASTLRAVCVGDLFCLGRS